MYEYILFRQNNHGLTEFYGGPMFANDMPAMLQNDSCWVSLTSPAVTDCLICRWPEPADALKWRDWCNSYIPDRKRYKVNCIFKGDVIL